MLIPLQTNNLRQWSGAPAQSATIEPRIHPRRRSAVMLLLAVAEEDMLDDITKMRERESDMLSCSLSTDYEDSNAGKHKTEEESRLSLCNR